MVDMKVDLQWFTSKLTETGLHESWPKMVYMEIDRKRFTWKLTENGLQSRWQKIVDMKGDRTCFRNDSETLVSFRILTPFFAEMAFMDGIICTKYVS